MDVMVTAKWLREHLVDEGVRVVDCRFVLGQLGAGRAMYLESHIASAAFLDLDEDLAGPVGNASRGRHPLPEPEAFAAAARRAGISNDTHVVAYDEDNTGGGARLWWLLRHFGHDAVSVLAGGFDAWDGPTSAGEEDIAPGNFTAGPARDDTVTADELLQRRGDPSLVVVDARAPQRYRGETEPIDPVPGRIPGAVNLPATEDVPADLVSAEGEIVAYCGSGVTAAAVLLKLAAAGRVDAKLYPGSYSEWCRSDLPIERGAARS